MKIRMQCPFLSLISTTNVVTLTLICDQLEVRLDNYCIKIFNTICLKKYFFTNKKLNKKFRVWRITYNWNIHCVAQP